MSHSLEGFTDYDANGKPYMGIRVQTETTQFNVYIARREDALATVAEFTRLLKGVAHDLTQMPDKLIAATGMEVNGNAGFRKGQG